TLAAAPSAIECSRTSSTFGSPGYVTIPGRTGTLTSITRTWKPREIGDMAHSLADQTNRRPLHGRALRSDRPRLGLGGARRRVQGPSRLRRTRRDGRARALGRRLPERRLPADEGVSRRRRPRARRERAGRLDGDRGLAGPGRPRPRARLE